MTDDNEREPRRSYEKPKVTVISLRPEEAVLSNCKAQNTHGPAAHGNCGSAGGCMIVGS